MKYAVKNEANSIASEPRNSSMASVAWLMCFGCSSGAPAVEVRAQREVLGRHRPSDAPDAVEVCPSVVTCSTVIVPAAVVMSSVISS